MKNTLLRGKKAQDERRGGASSEPPKLGFARFGEPHVLLPPTIPHAAVPLRTIPPSCFAIHLPLHKGGFPSPSPIGATSPGGRGTHTVGEGLAPPAISDRRTPSPSPSVSPLPRTNKKHRRGELCSPAAHTCHPERCTHTVGEGQARNPQSSASLASGNPTCSSRLRRSIRQT